LKTDLQFRGLQLGSLLNEGQYAHLADFLFDLQTAVEQTDQSELKNLTATALQICMFCQQCQTEMEWHRKADLQVRDRLSELNEQLDTLLNMITEYESQKERQQPALSVSVTLLDDRYRPVIVERPNIWQRISNLFNYEPNPRNPERQMTKVVVNTSFPSAFEKDERVTDLENISEELPPATAESKPHVRPAAEGDVISTSIFERLNPFGEVKRSDIPVPAQERNDNTSASNVNISQSREMPPSLVVYCLGAFRVYQNDQLITEWQSLKSQAIFKYLLSNLEVKVAKHILMDLFWPDATPEAARRNLHQAIYSLRQQMRGGQQDFQHIRFENDRYFLSPRINIWLDFNEFEQHVNAGRRLEANGNLAEAIGQYGIAEGLYLGEFLEEDLYEDWLRSQRQHFHNMYMEITDRLSRNYLHKGEHIASIALCRKLLNKDNCHEGSHRRLMKCFMVQGQRHLALRQYQTCVDTLRQELNIEPAASTIELYEQLRCRESNKP